MSNKNENENEVKVGDKVVMNQDYCHDGGILRGEIGKVERILLSSSKIYKVKFEGKKGIGLFRGRFDLAPDQPATPKPPEEKPVKKPVKKGIRITVREVKPDVFEIVDFTAWLGKISPLNTAKVILLSVLSV